ncbi:MAG: hypothetical protein US69_C0003G0011 [candidate division TM6 bacterium GW2011_GWF2_38_10]|nr:MAG: hypothetical protein US69_C0003G0011 [candidate division TM6 bacterium GW2011_GWF2_38_10]
MNNNTLSYCLLIILLTNTPLCFAKKRKKTTSLQKANIVLAPPRTFIRDPEAIPPVFTNLGSLNLEGSSLYVQKEENPLEDPLVDGNPINLQGLASSIQTNLGYIKGLGVYSATDQTFSVATDTLVDCKGPTDVVVVIDSGITSGVKQDEQSIRGLRHLTRDPYSRVGLRLAGSDSHLRLDLTFSDNSINLNGGSITLGQNFTFGDDVRFLNPGTINFNGKSLSFGGAELNWDTDIVWNQANDLEFNSKITLTGDACWYFDGDGHVTTNGNIIDISSGGKLWIRDNTSIYLSNAKIRGLGSGSIVFEDPSSRLVLSNVEIEMDNDVTFTTGGIYVDGTSTIVTKNHTMSFDTNASLTVNGSALWYDTLDQENYNNILPLHYDPINANNKYVTLLNHGVIAQKNLNYLVRTSSHAIAYYVPIVRGNSSAIIALQNNNTSEHETLANTIRYNSNTAAYNARANSNALEFYNRTNSNALEFYHRTTSNALLFGDRINSNAAAYNTRTNSNALEFYHRTTSNALLFGDRINSNTAAYNFRINSNLIDHIYRELADLETGGQGHIYFSRIDDLYNRVKANSDTILYNSGIIADHYVVTNAHETISNMRFIKQGFTIPDGNTLHINTPIRISGNINFGDNELGTLALDGDIVLAHDCYFTSPGIIDGNGHTLNITGSFVIPAGDHGFTFASNTTIYGNDQDVTIAPHASLYIDEHVSVTLCDMTLHLNNENAFQGPGTITLKDVIVCMNNDINKTSGNLHIDGTVQLQGNHAFNVLNDAHVTINPYTTWYFDKNTTLYYAPENDNRDLIYMSDSTSTLFLHGATLQSTSTGMRLTRGTIMLDHANTIYAHNGSLSEALAFGNNNPANNISMIILPGASLNIANGIVDYANNDEQ